MQTPIQFGIIADDLTGAADVVAPFAERGLSAAVALNFHADVAAQASAWNAETRALSDAQEVARRVEAVAANLQRHAPPCLYKKIDSALRGWLALELEVWRRAFPRRIAIICPAFPANGRVMRGDVLFIHGKRWQETEFAQPGETRGAAAMFGVEGEAIALSLETMSAGLEGVGKALETIREGGVALCSAATESDLDALAEAIMRAPHRYLPVGSAGLSRAIARRTTRMKPPSNSLLAPFREEKVLAVIGSRHVASRAQVLRVAEDAGIQPVVWDGIDEFETAQEMRRRFAQGARFILATTTESDSDPALSRGLGRIARDILTDFPDIRALFLTGGDAAFHVAQELHVSHMEVFGEIEPGLALGAFRTERGESWAAITKAGGFGDPDTLLRILTNSPDRA